MIVEMFPNENFKPIIYNSLADAAAAYGSKKSSSRIADVCNDKYKQAFGFKWCWYGSAIS